MTAYQVIASNKWYFQNLVVVADGPKQAAAKFQAYLDAPQNKADEEYEMDQTKYLGDEADPEALERSNYTYKFQDRDVEEFEPTPNIAPTADVRMVHSGGNG